MGDLAFNANVYGLRRSRKAEMMFHVPVSLTGAQPRAGYEGGSYVTPALERQGM